MREYFERQQKDPEYQQILDSLEPGYQFARAISALQARLGVTFEEFCHIVEVPQDEMETILREFRVPPAPVLKNILSATHSRIDFKPDEEAAAVSA